MFKQISASSIGLKPLYRRTKREKEGNYFCPVTRSGGACVEVRPSFSEDKSTNQMVISGKDCSEKNGGADTCRTFHHMNMFV